MPYRETVIGFSPVPLSEGGVSIPINTGAYFNGHLMLNGSDDLRVEVQGIIVKGPGAYKPGEDEWVTKQVIVGKGFFAVEPLPSLMRLRVLAGTLTYATMDASPDAMVSLSGVAAPQGSGASAEVLAAIAKMPQRTFTPEQFGAKGDGVTSDHKAFFKLNDAVANAGGGRIVLSQPYLLGRYTTNNPLQAGFLDFQHIKDLSLIIEFVGQGCMLLDNLGVGKYHHPTDPEDVLRTGLVGDQYSGIVIRGGAEYIEMIRPRIRWVHQPDGRTNGSGICVKGYPDEKHPEYIKRCIIRDPEVSRAPQAGVVTMGVDNLLVTNHRTFDTMADSLHINACRNPVVNGPARAIWTGERGDDGLALVTYFGDENRPLGPGEGYSASDHIFTPFQTTVDSEWANGNVQADGVWRKGGIGHACRTNGVNGGHIGSIIAEDSQRAYMADATKRDGSSSAGWNAAVSRGLKIDSIISRNCGQAAAFVTNAARGENDNLFIKHDIEIGSIQATGTTDASSVVVDKVDGIHVSSVTLDKDLLIIGGSAGIKVDRATVRNVLIDAGSVVSFGNVQTGRFDVFGNSKVTASAIRSDNADGQVMRLVGMANGSVTVGVFEVNYPNRSNGSANHIMLLAPASNVNITKTIVRQDNHSTRLLEIGGGGPDGISNNIDLSSIEYSSTGPTPLPDIAMQGGTYAPRNVRYSLRASNDNGKTWQIDNRDTYNVRKVINDDSDKVVAWGDSRTEVTEGNGWTVQIQPMIGRDVVNLGIAGQSSGQIAARSGATPYSAIHTISNIIPGDGSAAPLNVLTNEDLLSSQVTRFIDGTVGGAHVRLSRVIPGGGYFVQRYPPTGTDVPLADPTDFIPDNPYRSYINVIWGGRNDNLSTPEGIAKLKERIAAMVSILQGKKRYVIVGELNGQNEPNGNTICENIKAYNASQNGTYGAFFVDPRSIICVNDNGSPRGDGTPNPAWMLDNVHPNRIGQYKIAAAIAAVINSQNW